MTSRRAWTAVVLAGLLVVLVAAGVGLLVRPDGLREVAAGETVSLAAPPPGVDGSVTRDVALDGGVGVRLSTSDSLGDARDVVPPEGGTFVVVRVVDPRRSSPSPDGLPVTTTITLVDGERRYEVSPDEAPAGWSGARTAAVAVALDRRGEDAFEGLVLEAERNGALTTVDLAPEVPEPSPPVPTEAPTFVSRECAPAVWPAGWTPGEDAYDACVVTPYPLVPALGILGPAPDGSVWLPLVVDTEGDYLEATRADGTYYPESLPTSVVYRLGDLEPALVVPTTALQPPDRLPRADGEDLVVFAVPADTETAGLTLTFTATYDARRGGPDPRPTVSVALQRSTALGE